MSLVGSGGDPLLNGSHSRLRGGGGRRSVRNAVVAVHFLQLPLEEHFDAGLRHPAAAAGREGEKLSHFDFLVLVQ